MITEQKKKKEIPSQKVRKKEKTVKTQIWQSIKSTDNQHNEETYEITIFFPKKVRFNDATLLSFSSENGFYGKIVILWFHYVYNTTFT